MPNFSNYCGGKLYSFQLNNFNPTIRYTPDTLCFIAYLMIDVFQCIITCAGWIHYVSKVVLKKAVKCSTCWFIIFHAPVANVFILPFVGS